MTAFLSITANMEYERMGEIRSKIREGLEKIAEKGVEIKSRSRVAVKINNMGPYPPEAAACTHPAVLRAVIEELKKLDVAITVYEDCLQEDYIEVSGIGEVIRDTGVPFVNLKNRPYVKITVEGVEYEYSKDLLEADYLVAVPKMKTHVLTSYTGAIKLMYGNISKAQRKMFHCYDDMKDFSKILVDIYSIKIPVLVVMDGIISMDGIGPSHGKPNPSGLLLVSDDGVLLDYHASRLMKYDPKEIDSIRIAMERGLAQCETEELEFPGDDMGGVKLDFSLVPTLSGAKGKRFRSIVIGQLALNEALCTRCGICRESCPFSAISLEEFPVIDLSRCIKCYCCLELCPNGAFELKKKFGK